jgi:hypothetical protein
MEIIKELEELDKIRDIIINKSREAAAQGFAGEGEYAVFKKVRAIISREETAREITGRIYADTAGELLLSDWDKKSQVLKDLRKKIKFILKDYIGATDMQKLAHELVNILIENKRPSGEYNQDNANTIR